MASVESVSIENNDRISELPRNVMDYIFKGMSIRDVVRTSILSRKWRYIWASYPKLVFDRNFFNKIDEVAYEAGDEVLYKKLIPLEITKAISNVLLVHSGPIIELFLYIPNIPNDLSPTIDQWMLFLSRNGIKKLELSNSNPNPYILPSCICSCSSLIDLKLKNCVLKLPYEFEGFRYLVNLRLEKVSFFASMSATLVLNTPLLETLTLINCTGIEHRRIYAPRLHLFCIINSGKVDWQWVASNKQLTTVQIELRVEVEIVDWATNMIHFLENIPKIKTLWMDGFSLKYLAARNQSKGLALKYLAARSQSKGLATPTLPHALVPFLTEVRLRGFGVDDLDQISSVLCLLKNCPNLVHLELEIVSSVYYDKEPVTEYFESFNCMDMSFDMLKKVDIKFMNGLKVELLLIKLLLARSKCLHSMIIKQRTGISDSDGFKISRELLGFPRASTSAKIIYVI